MRDYAQHINCAGSRKRSPLDNLIPVKVQTKKATSSLSFMTSGITHKLRAFEPDLSCVGGIRRATNLSCPVLYCIRLSSVLSEAACQATVGAQL